jgi:8-oxo-dGTP diphosphatase
MKQGFDYIGVTVCFYCHDGKGNLLLNKRSQNCRDEKGRWDCGGGAVKFGETWEQAARREIKEEYCCEIVKLDFVGVNNVLRTHEGRKTHWVAVIFAAQLEPKKVKICDKDKIDEIAWFKLNKLPKPLHSMYLTHLEYVKKAKIL